MESTIQALIAFWVPPSLCFTPFSISLFQFCDRHSKFLLCNIRDCHAAIASLDIHFGISSLKVHAVFVIFSVSFSRGFFQVIDIMCALALILTHCLNLASSLRC
ncbi:uncharacterized protein LOC111007652 isoform X2 [Momordica charantia]|uniref:Uncharacterized protein LOC111007652 isoform X2 n=1 Tax=Momordica charantia TaxID=3673 RepID=A0A6J1C3R2_MOMCH|nr:uncharacterized protein LOC111007652 isoform X2 [Momordica charantia]